MSADATAGRYQFPSALVDDPARALADLADTPALVDDIVATVTRVQIALEEGYGLDDFHTLRRELHNLRRRLEAITARLST